MYTETENEAPKWAKVLIENLIKTNERLVETVKCLHERQDRIESKLNGKPEKEDTPAEPTPEQIKDVCEKLFI